MNSNTLRYLSPSRCPARAWFAIVIGGLTLFALEAMNALLFPHAGYAQEELISSAPLPVQVSGNKLSVSLKEASLADILQEISRQTGIKMVYKTPPAEKVTCHFKDLPLEKGLKKLLDGQNFLFSYTRNEETGGGKPHYAISQVHLVEKSETNPRNAAAFPRTAAPMNRPPRLITPPAVPQPTLPAPAPPAPPVPAPQPEAAPAAPVAPETPKPTFSPELINELLKQDPEIQAEAQKIVNETMKNHPEQANQQLMNLLERYIQQEEKKGSQVPGSVAHMMEQLSKGAEEAPAVEAPAPE